MLLGFPGKRRQAMQMLLVAKVLFNVASDRINTRTVTGRA